MSDYDFIPWYSRAFDWTTGLLGYLLPIVFRLLFVFVAGGVIGLLVYGLKQLL